MSTDEYQRQVIGAALKCVRCDSQLESADGPIYCRACSKVHAEECKRLSPYTHAYCIVSDKRLEIMRAEGRVSSEGCRILRRVLDYLDIMSDIEIMDWPDEIGG